MASLHRIDRKCPLFLGRRCCTGRWSMRRSRLTDLAEHRHRPATASSQKRALNTSAATSAMRLVSDVVPWLGVVSGGPSNHRRGGSIGRRYQRVTAMQWTPPTCLQAFGSSAQGSRTRPQVGRTLSRRTSCAIAYAAPGGRTLVEQALTRSLRPS